MAIPNQQPDLIGETAASVAYAEAQRRIGFAQERHASVLDLHRLRSLEEIPPEISDLKNLRSLNLGGFLSGTRVSDLSPLAGLVSLQRLHLGRTAVADLRPIAHLQSLRTLLLPETRVSDLTPLARLTKLERLNLYRTAVTDLAPLATLTRLLNLDLRKTRVSDLSPLAELTGLVRGAEERPDRYGLLFTETMLEDPFLRQIADLPNPDRTRMAIEHIRTLAGFPGLAEGDLFTYAEQGLQRSPRREATVIFCDIRNSSSLMLPPGHNKDDVLRDLRDEWSSIIRRYGGVIVQSRRDNVLAYFLDNSLGAARAALEISATGNELDQRSIPVRVGVATGPVDITRIGGKHAAETVPRIAAGLSQIATGNSAVVDGITRDQIGPTIQAEFLGHQNVPKGETDQVQVWRLIPTHVDSAIPEEHSILLPGGLQDDPPIEAIPAQIESAISFTSAADGPLGILADFVDEQIDPEQGELYSRFRDQLRIFLESPSDKS